AAGAGRRRGEIGEMIKTGGLEGAHLALAPLFDRYDAAAVAAALYHLWTGVPGPGGKAGAREAGPAAGPPGATPAPGASTSRIWVGVGRKDGATANDLVGTLTREVGVDRQKIGKVEIRELYTLVEVPAPEAEDIARSLMGRTIRRRRVAARLDRGATRRE
ncbi:MAG: DbpA RNA binding domain-containing protein, partial [Gemmatimonadales bacterium]